MKANLFKLVKRRWRTIIGVFVTASGIAMVGRDSYKEGMNDIVDTVGNAFKRKDYWDCVFKADKEGGDGIIDEEYRKLYK